MENPFENSPVATRPQQNQALVEVEQQRAVAEVQSAIVLAKKFPREPVKAMDRILTTCQREGLAAQALYAYARGGTDITGPTIRLAEAIAQNWGNLAYGVRELEQRNGESTVEAFCWDMETNTKAVKAFQVKHERYTRASGKKSLEDPRDIYEMVANQGARRLRACILEIIPGDVTEAAVNQCEKTLKTTADISSEAQKKLIDAFAAFKVTKEQVEKRIQRRLDAITAAQMIQMGKIYLSLKDGMSSASDWFDVVPESRETKTSPTESLKEKIKKQTHKEPENVVEMAPGPCPDHPEITYKVAHCAVCQTRPGCPTWGEIDQQAAQSNV